MTSRLEQLERLVQLRDAGALTAEEFDAEKARVLAALEGEAVAPPTGRAGTNTARAGVAAAATVGAPKTPSDANDESASDELSWNPFERPADVAVAERLSRFGLLAGGLLIAHDLTLIGNLALQSLSGATFDDGSTYASAFLPAVGILFIFLAIDAGLTFASWRGRARWSAIGLLAVSSLATVGSMLEILDGRTIWRVIQLVVSMAAFFFAIQAVRGAFWLKAMGGLAGLSPQRAESESQMARAFSAQMPAAARRRWLMIVGGAALVVIAVGIVSSLSENTNPREGAPATLAADATSPTMPGRSASSDTAPVLSLPPLVSGQPFAQARQQLISAGYSPMPIELNGECPGGMCQAYPEVMECSGMGSSPDAELYAPCTLRYRRNTDNAWIIVRTTGEYMPDYDQDVEFHDMAVMNIQDQGIVAEIERQYAGLPSY